MPKQQSKPNLIYALDANGKPVHIDSVPNGRVCGCRCPRCNGELEARNGGTERAHHFAHGDGADCVGAVESAIHCLAKEILKETLCVCLPQGAGIQKFDRIDTEKNYPELKLRPDCVGYYGNKQLWVEFKRTHEVDAQKAGKIISARIDCIEIDLTECEQDKEKLREFITQSSEKRKWIYSEQYGIGLSDFETYNRAPSQKDDSEASNEKIARHFALDDNGQLIDLRVPGEFDALNHSYYCPNCEKEVVLNVDDNGGYSFAHIEESVLCDDEMYLRETAVAAIQKSFIQSAECPIEITQYRTCKEAQKCPCFQEECKVSTTKCFDLKKHGYSKIKKNHKFNDVSYRTDLVLHGDNIKPDDVIEVLVNTENYENELGTKRRLIEVTVYDENDICQLERGLNNFSRVRLSGFNSKAKEPAELKEIQSDIWKYTIYTSGKIHIGQAKCTELHPSVNQSNILKEGIFTRIDASLEELYVFLLLRYKTLKKEICRCRLCYYLRESNGLSNDCVCICYKTVGTPKIPLKEKNPPINCPFFKMNYDILNREKELNERIDILEL